MSAAMYKVGGYDHFAEVSYADVRSLVSSGTLRYTLLCHCCQQCVEKYFKHVAVMKGEPAGSAILGTQELSSLAPFVEYPGVEWYSDVLRVLGESYSSLGYPNVGDIATPVMPTADFVRSAVELVDSVRDWVRSLQQTEE